MARSARHRGWAVPQAELTGPEATIHIRPSRRAKYLPLEWRFELDQEVVFNLLIRDVYTSKNVFIRELLQNAFDASRCQIYLDMTRDGEQCPEYPYQVSEERRRRYPVRISVIERLVPNELSGRKETRQFVVVEDQGIGMDKEIIQKYFLQVGRSFYVTDEFQRNFRFVPTSRFGVGFLSVFAVSDRVIVETYKPTSHAQDGPTRLTLTGPKNYLLTERGDRRMTGTKIEVTLSEPLQQGELTELVSNWCRRVEFPILVDDLGKTTAITAEQLASFLREEPDLDDAEASFTIRCFPIAAPGISGEIYIFSHAFAKGESWVDWNWAKHSYLEQNPRASIPPVPESLTCLHGIRVSKTRRTEGTNFAIRLDIRREHQPTTLARERLRDKEARGWPLDYLPEVVNRLGEILSEHMATTPFAMGADGWKYKQRLIGKFPLPVSFWRTVPGTVRTVLKRSLAQKSVAELEEEELITLAVPVDWSRFDKPCAHEKWVLRMLLRLAKLEGIVISAYDLPTLEDICRTAALGGRQVVDVRFLSNSVMAFAFRRPSAGHFSHVMLGNDRSELLVASFPDAEPIGIEFHLAYFSPSLVVLNSQNTFAQWYLRARGACQEGLFNLNKEMLDRLDKLLGSAISYGYGRYVGDLAAYVDAWSTMPGLTRELYPPKAKLGPEGFRLHRRNPQKQPPRAPGAKWH